MNSKLFIADKIKVGFNERTDTYTGMLGYVIGHDGKKWRKEPSWEGWREKYMSDEEYEARRKRDYEQALVNTKSNYEWHVKETEKHPNHYYAHHVKDGYDAFFAKQLGSYAKYKPFYRGYSNDINIEPKEFENVPTEGFVLNKKAGGHSSGWNHRSTYCRVYDPRGFEFEITIPNLLFILQECNAMKGKGLEGTFVYAWDGKDLVLLPTSSEDYVTSSHFTKMQSGKVSTKDLVEGHTYKTKNLEDYIYVGRFNFLTDKYRNNWVSCTKQHIFYPANGVGDFMAVSSMDKFSQKVTDTCISNYAEILDKFNNSKYSFIPSELQIANLSLPRVLDYYEYDKTTFGVLPLGDNKFQFYRILCELGHEGYYDRHRNVKAYTISTENIVEINENGDVKVKKGKEKVYDKISFDEASKLNLKSLLMKNKTNKKLVF